MTFLYNNDEYEIVIDKKITTKNTYIRVKNDLKIYITTNSLTTNKYIENLIRDNYKSIVKMIEKEKIKLNNNSDFNYLGNKYEIVYVDYCDFEIGNTKVFMNKNFNIDYWYKKKAKELYRDHLDNIYNMFSRNIPYPDLRIRKMTTRWGVCNTKSKTITLNLELIKRDTKYLDYVIVHELSHLIYPNHSSSFWDLVGENCKDYKKIRNEMKNF